MKHSALTGRGLLTIRAALIPSSVRLGAAHAAGSWLR